MHFDLSSYNKLKKEMTVLEKQIVSMREISKQLIAMHSNLANDHNRESLEFEQEFQQMVRQTFNLSRGQDIDTLNRASIPCTGAGKQQPLATTPSSGS